MNHLRSRVSPQVVARIGGVLYLIIILIGIVGEGLIREPLIVSGNAAATAERIRAAEPLWRAGIAGELVLLTCGTALTLIFYVLLRPVSRELALLAVFFNLVSIAIEAVASIHLMESLYFLGGSYMSGVAAAQRDAFAYLSTRLHGYGFGVALIFFGWVCLVVGTLIFRSGYFPKLIGILMQIAGVCYLIDSFALILDPPLASRLFPAILLPSLIGESSFCLWLLVKGVDVPRWKLRVSEGMAAPES